MLTAYIDFKSAGSLLAIDPLIGLAERTGLAIEWQPFSTEPRDLPDSGADQTVIESHHRVREQALRAMDSKYAALRGIALHYPPEEGCCDLALGVLAQIEGDRLPFIRACFDAYWRDHADLDDPQTVTDLIDRSGARYKADWAQTRSAFDAAQARAEAAGVVNAPAFLIAGQIFIGRQHLPWIEEIATSPAG